MVHQPTYEELMAHLGDLLAPCLAQDWPNLPTDRGGSMSTATMAGATWISSRALAPATWGTITRG